VSFRDREGWWLFLEGFPDLTLQNRDLHKCTELNATLDADWLLASPASTPVTVRNPDPADCTSYTSYDVKSIAFPTLAAFSPNVLCGIPNQRVTLQGTNIIRLDGSEPEVFFPNSFGISCIKTCS